MSRRRNSSVLTVAIVYWAKWMAAQIYDRCQHAHMPVEWLNRDQDSQLYDAAAPSVKLVTMHSSRGLEFSVVFVPGVGYLPHQQSTPEDEARLLYMAMTRAIDQLVLTCDRDSGFVQRLGGLNSKSTAMLESQTR